MVAALIAGIALDQRIDRHGRLCILRQIERVRITTDRHTVRRSRLLQRRKLGGLKTAKHRLRFTEIAPGALKTRNSLPRLLELLLVLFELLLGRGGNIELLLRLVVNHRGFLVSLRNELGSFRLCGIALCECFIPLCERVSNLFGKSFAHRLGFSRIKRQVAMRNE
jgi:hypothetical protein